MLVRTHEEGYGHRRSAEVIRGLLRSYEFIWGDVKMAKVTTLLVMSHEDGYGHSRSAEVKRCHMKSTKII